MLQEFLNKVNNPVLKDKLEGIFNQIQQEFPSLTTEIKWNQPMFIHWILCCQGPYFHCTRNGHYGDFC
ncbi:hypothetical protein [Streptococcus suis]|uniref:hypothetical protein n=1 Tax=Streptococcus suis TaxID=1307 RepID=UPI0003F655B1|nr:hypothetical protein [Streptococcus suis]